MAYDIYKKSQIQLVTVVLIVLISLVALAIVAGVVIPLIREKGNDADSEGLLVDLEVTEGVVLLTETSKITIKRGAGGSLSSLNFVFYDEKGNIYIKTIKKDLIGELETKTYSFAPIDNFGKIESVSVTGDVRNKGNAKGLKVFGIPKGLESWWRFDNEKDFLDDGDVCNLNENIEEGELILNGNFFSCSGELESLGDGAIGFLVRPEGDGPLFSGKNYDIAMEPNMGYWRIVFSYNELNILSDPAVNLNEWSHVFVSKSGESLSIYVDGVFSGQGKIPDFEMDSSVISIGGFDGRIDEVMIFEEGLSGIQVKGIYENVGR